MKKRIICIFLVTVIISLNLMLVVAGAVNEKTDEVFPHAIAYSKAEDMGLKEKVEAVEVVEYETGRIIVDTNIDKTYNPGVKEVVLMAVYTALSEIETDSITVNANAVTDEKNNTLAIKGGMNVAVIDLAAAALLGNDINAVNALALATKQSVPDFVNRMNIWAKYFKMSHTNYTNVNGSFDAKQVTSVSDMTILTYMCYKNQTIMDITSAETHYIKTNEILEKKKILSNPFELVNSNSEFFNRNVFGIGISNGSNKVTTSLITYITSKQKFIIVLRSKSENCYKDIVSTLDYVKKNYALIDISKIIFELGENTTLVFNGEKVCFTAMKNTVSNVNVVANLYFSKSVSTINEAYTIEPPEKLPESVNVGDVISGFKILYNGNQVSTISLSVKSIGEEVTEEKTLGFTIYNSGDIQIQKGSFIQEHSWLIIVGIVLVIGAALIIGVNNLKNI